MKNIVYILIFVVCFYSNSFSQVDCSNNFNLSWVKYVGNIDVDQANDVVSDSQGNVYVTGYYMGDLYFWPINLYGMGLKDMFVAKLDPDGNLIWITSVAGVNNVYGTGITLDNDGNVIVTGTFKGQAFVESYSLSSNNNSTDIILIKYDTDGNLLWYKSVGGNYDDYSAKVKVDIHNNIILAGTFNTFMNIGSQNLSANQNSFFIAKYNSAGNFIWAKTANSSSDNNIVDIAVDNLGNIIGIGNFAGTITFESDILNAIGNKDIFLVKYNSNSDYQWSKRLGSSGNEDKAGGVSIDLNLNVYAFYKNDIANSQGHIDKFNTMGNFMQSIAFGSSAEIIPGDILLDDSGNIFITGGFKGNADFGGGIVTCHDPVYFDIFIVKYNQDASFAFQKTAHSGENSFAAAVSFDNEANLIIGGYANQNLVVEGNNYYGYGKSDILVYKYERYFGFDNIIISSINCDPNNMCIDIGVNGGTPPYIYTWSSGYNTEDICGISVGNYSVTVTDSDNCFITTNIIVEPPQATPINLSSSLSVCPFDTVTLNAGTNYLSYLWSTNQTTSSIQVFNPGIYSVTVTDLNLCSTSATVEITKLDNVNLIIDNIKYFCVGESINFSVVGFDEYLWSNGITNPTFTSTTPGIYWLRAYDGNCYYYDTIQILNYPKPEVNLGNDRFFCLGDSIRIDAPQGFTTYIWHDNSTNTYYWANSTELINLTVIDNNGCSTSDALFVTALDYPQLSLGENIEICTNSAIILKPLFVDPNVTFLWNNGSTLDSLIVNQTGVYSLTVTNIGNCSNSDTISVIIYPQPGIELGPDIHFCEGENALLSVTGSFESIIWNTGDTTQSIIVSETGKYSVYAFDQNGCVANDSVYVIEHILPPLNLGQDTTYCEGDVHILKPEYEYFHYHWQDGSYASSLSVSGPGTYSLTVADQMGCSLTASVNINYVPKPQITNVFTGGGRIILYVDGGTQPYVYSYNGDSWQNSSNFDYLTYGFHTMYVMDKNYCIDTEDVYLDTSLDIPSFFTPNGDGYNDIWIIGGLHMFPNAEVQIFDRFGKKLFEFSSSDNGWNGTYLGNPLPSDTYWYTIRTEEGLKPFIGNVTIVR